MPDVLSYNEYYPYGMLLPGRHGAVDSYRYGFQGQEKDDEIKGEGNSLNYKYRMHDPRLGRFFAIDPLAKQYPFYSPYQFSGNKVIQFKELEGAEELIASVDKGETFPSISNLSGEKLVIDMFLFYSSKMGSKIASDISYKIAFKKLGKGFLMGSNGKIYQNNSLKLSEELIDGKFVSFLRGKDRANQWFTTSNVNQVNIFRNKKWVNLSEKLLKLSSDVDKLTDVAFFVNGSIEQNEIDAFGLLDISISMGFGPLATVATDAIKSQIDKNMNELITQPLLNDLDAKIKDGLSPTEEWVDIVRGQWQTFEGYEIIRLTSTALGTYFSGQVSDLNDLQKISGDIYGNGDEEMNNALLIQRTDNNEAIIMHIFIDDSSSSENNSSNNN
ncbi:RHS repeat domain-containing protein [Flavobacterium sp. CS20]|uniref:RHS repeat domain-containing protein n=1 Tax=Flavobacterium sp. CS20 TaxID=2775246 RepID=UPI001B3A2D20|nr:RHS repeat-associated core domain-containing protein [Flavobacterium sp. CS20]QTY27320.1 hypothetical protein IGB25_01685 [Flavobacterium sp. CS20]